MLRSYLHEAHVLMFMYDITNNASFMKLNDWYTASNYILTEQTTFAEPGDKLMTGKTEPFLALVGNKSDMQHIRAVKQEKIREFTEKTSIAEIALVSAQSGDGVHALFRKITATVLGLRLGRADFEQDIVAAQIPHEQKDPHPVAKPPMTKTRSTVCSLC
ncbi:hypothetical protein RvY_08439-2 [Ramazzottius varieornatus]|uniref:Uncharacterized protein n=1 Tax=Ramazzottius varieornatus TaxID=947166 RepID=A0A1D1V846_RAMVA|nr:hypothetical protein RvY_08439-2 [Ramazzottius varieornatus]